jgi:hypothetical protein
MKKRIVTIIVAALALLTLTAASNAAAPTVSGGVLVKTDDGYIITGTLRDAGGRVVGTVHGTLTELTTGFNSCPLTGTTSLFCYPPFTETPWTCNLLGGEITFNFQGRKYDAVVGGDAIGHTLSSLCQDRDSPTAYGLLVYAWSGTHTIPGNFPEIFVVFGGVQQISPTVFEWSGGWDCACYSPPT